MPDEYVERQTGPKVQYAAASTCIHAASSCFTRSLLLGHFCRHDTQPDGEKRCGTLHGLGLFNGVLHGSCRDCCLEVPA